MGFNLYKIFKSFSRLEQLIFLGAVIIFIVSGSVYLWNYIEKNTLVLPASGGTYKEGVVGQPIYLNPVIAGNNDANRNLIALIYSSLADVADKISVSPDKNTWTIRLKENIRWHDGERLTADDVVFTIQKIQDPGAHSPLSIIWQGVNVARESELELNISTGAPYVYFEENLKNLYIVPKHIFANVPVANWPKSDFNLEPVGSGLYAVKSHREEKNGFISEYRLVRNENYFGSKPFLENVDLEFFPDEVSAIQAYNSARIDALGGVDPKNLPLLKRSYNTADLRLPRYYAVFFNQGVNDMLKNLSIRQALNYAVDKKDIINQVWRGRAAISDGPEPMGQTSTAAPNLNFDPNQASQLLDDAKLKKGEDGMRGEIKLVVPQLNFLVDTANIIKKNWEAVGIKTTLIILDPASINNDIIKTRNYEAILFGNIFANNQDMFSFWHSSERFYPGLNLGLYSNKTADKLIENIRKDFNPESRDQSLETLKTAIVSDAPALFLYSPNYIFITNPKIKGVKDDFISTASGRFLHISDWYINTRRVFK